MQVYDFNDYLKKNKNIKKMLCINAIIHYNKHYFMQKRSIMQPDQMIDAICKNGMSQSKIAECLGVNQSTISRWLNNHHDMPYKSAKKLEQLYIDKVVKGDKI